MDEVDIGRAKRYKDETNIIFKRADQIAEWALDLAPEQFLDDDRTKLATYKGFQEIAEACMDIVVMMCKDTGLVPKDDYSNIENLKELDVRTKAILAEANGLRNRLVHRYNQMDDLLALESMKSLIPEILDFAEEVELWVRKRL